MILLIVVLLFLILLLFAFVTTSLRTIGGYDGSKFKQASKQPNPKDYEKPNIGQDKYFKSLLYSKYKDTLINDVEIKGYVPDKINYIDGGFSDIRKLNEAAKTRVELDDAATYEPDFVIEIGSNKYLVIEFDEGNEYHQDSTIFRYQTKNFIYSEMLHSADEDQNIVILRICYNSGVNLWNGKDTDMRKEDTDRKVPHYINRIIYLIIEDEIKNQYVLMKLESDNLKIKQTEYHTRIKELVGIKARENIEFKEPDYSYFQINLNTKKYIDGRSCEDKFIITDYFKE